MGMPKEFVHTYTSDASGDAEVIEVGTLFRGNLEKLIVHQSSGALDGFTVKVFNNENDADNDVDSGRIMPVLTADAADSFVETFDNFAYEVRDQDTTNKPKSKLWFRIDPAGSAAKDFTIAFAVTVDMY